jgi:hypothetical protein
MRSVESPHEIDTVMPESSHASSQRYLFRPIAPAREVTVALPGAPIGGRGRRVELDIDRSYIPDNVQDQRLPEVPFSAHRAGAGGVSQIVLHGQSHTGNYYGMSWPQRCPFLVHQSGAEGVELNLTSIDHTSQIMCKTKDDAGVQSCEFPEVPFSAHRAGAGGVSQIVLHGQSIAYSSAGR